MRFGKLLVGVLVPTVVYASVAPPATFDMNFDALLAKRDMALVPRADLANTLDSILDLLNALKKFLTADFFDDTYAVVSDLADLLGNPFVNQTRGIIGQASGLLTDVKPVIDQLKNFDLAAILKIFDGIDIAGLVRAVTGLLTPESINGIQGLLKNAQALLTAEFVANVTQLIGDATPVSRSRTRCIPRPCEHSTNHIAFTSLYPSLLSSLPPFSLLFWVVRSSRLHREWDGGRVTNVHILWARRRWRKSSGPRVRALYQSQEQMRAVLLELRAIIYMSAPRSVPTTLGYSTTAPSNASYDTPLGCLFTSLP